MSDAILQDDPFAAKVAEAVAQKLRENPPITREWFTVAEISVYLNKPEHTIREMIRAGDIPAHKLGHQWRVNKSELDECLMSS